MLQPKDRAIAKQSAEIPFRYSFSRACVVSVSLCIYRGFYWRISFDVRQFICQQTYDGSSRANFCFPHQLASILKHRSVPSVSHYLWSLVWRKRRQFNVLQNKMQSFLVRIISVFLNRGSPGNSFWLSMAITLKDMFVPTEPNFTHYLQ